MIKRIIATALIAIGLAAASATTASAGQLCVKGRMLEPLKDVKQCLSTNL